MKNLNLKLNHHEANTHLPCPEESETTYLIFSEGLWYFGAYCKEQDVIADAVDNCFGSQDDFMWAELPKEM